MKEQAVDRAAASGIFSGRAHRCGAHSRDSSSISSPHRFLIICMRMEKVFNAIQTTDLADVKVVILGQDIEDRKSVV